MDDRARILIVDDDKSARKTLSAVLGRLGYETDTAETGQEALEKAQEKCFNLAILDVRLPDMNGVALLAPLKTMHPDMIVVMVTAYATVETAVRALNDGAFAYIIKPINTDELLATIREGLEKQRLIEGKRQAECAKGESDEALRAFIENARDAIFARDLAGKLIDANRQVETLIGYSREEIIGNNFIQMGVLPDDQIPRTMARLDKNVTGDMSEPFELELITKGGSRIAVEIMNFSASRNGNEEIWCIARDITERKQAEQALRESEERFRALTEHGSDGVSIVGADGTSVYESESLQRILGYEAVSQIGGNVFDLVHPEDQASAEEAFQSVLSNPSESLTVVLRIRDAEGSWHWMECTGRNLLDSPAVGGVVINYHDVTERKQAEEALQESEEHFRRLVENSFDGVVLVDRDGSILYESPSGERILGYAEQELVGKSIAEIVHPDDIASVSDHFGTIVSSPGATAFIQVRFRHKDGSWRWCEATGKNLLDDPRVHAIIANYRDITDRKQAEEALRENDERLQALITNAPDAIVIADAAGNLIGLNKKVEELTGYSEEELLGKNFTNTRLFADEDTPKLLEIGANSLEGKVTEPTEVEFITKEGSRLCAEMKAFPVDNRGQAEVIAIARDITERKQAEERLRESEEKYRSVVERADAGIAIVQDGVMKYLNPRLEEMLGCEPEELIDAPMLNLVHPDERAKVADRHKRRMQGERVPDTYETLVLHKDGSGVEVELSSGVITYEGRPAALGILRDITERKQAEEALRESEQRFRQIAEHAQEWVWEVDDRGLYTYASPVVEKMLGHKPDELVGKKHFYDLFHPEDREALKKGALEAFEQKQTFRNFVNRNVHKNGETVWLSTSGVPILNEEGELLGYRGVDTDITEQKRTEQALRDSEERFRALIENAPDALAILNADGTIAYESPATKRMFGGQVQELVGTSFADFIHPDDIAGLTGTFDSIMTTPEVSVEFETRFRHADGSWRWAEGVGKNLLGDPKVGGIVVNYWDITERKEAEAALRASEERLKLIFNNASDQIVLVDLTGTIVSTNDRVTELFGLTPEEVIGQSFADLGIFDSEQLSELAEVFMECVSQQTAVRPRMAVRAKHRDGHEIILETRATTVMGPEGKLEGFLSVLTDVTERERATQALQESEQRLNTILNSLLTGVVVVDAETHTIVDANPLATEMIGAPKEDIVGRECHTFICPAEKGRCPVSDLDQRVDKSERALLTAQGERIPILKTVIPTALNGRIHFVESFIDITERKRSEEALRESQERLQYIFDSVGDLIVLADPSGNILSVNNSVETIFGWSADEVVGRNFIEIGVLHPDDMSMVISMFVDAVSTGNIVPKCFEIRGINKDGHEIPLEVASSAVFARDSEGKVQGLLTTMRDITERKRSEEEVAKVKREKDAELVQSAKLANLGEMATGIAHEINQPLNIIKLTCSGLDRSMKKGKTITPETLTEELGTINGQIERMRAIIDHMRSFARRSSDMKSEYTDMNVPLRDCFKFVGEQLRLRQVEVHLELEELPQVMADSNKIEQVFLNLVGNARDAMDNFAESAGSDYKKLLKVRSFVENGNAVVTFTDTGGGIPEKIRDRVFEPFFTTKEVGKGTGLGLSISYNIIRDADGQLDFSVEEGVGTTFRVAVPISQKQPQGEDQD